MAENARTFDGKPLQKRIDAIQNIIEIYLVAYDHKKTLSTRTALLTLTSIMSYGHRQNIYIKTSVFYKSWIVWNVKNRLYTTGKAIWIILPDFTKTIILDVKMKLNTWSQVTRRRACSIRWPQNLLITYILCKSTKIKDSNRQLMVIDEPLIIRMIRWQNENKCENSEPQKPGLRTTGDSKANEKALNPLYGKEDGLINNP